MGKTVNLYNNQSDKRVVDKELTLVDTVECTFMQPLDVNAPRLKLRYDSKHMQTNYVYIPDLGRYYYCNKPILQSGNVEIIDCTEIDTLMSYSKYFRKLPAIIKKQENKYNLYLQDEIKTDSRNRHKTITFSDNWFTNRPPKIVLTTTM